MLCVTRSLVCPTGFTAIMTKSGRQYHRIKLNQRMTLISNEPRKIGCSYKGNNLGRNQYGPVTTFDDGCTPQAPLCIILGWLAGKERYLMKFASLYLDQEFDVLILRSPQTTVIHPMGSVKVSPAPKNIKFTSLF